MGNLQPSTITKHLRGDQLCGSWKISPRNKSQRQGHKKEQVRYAELFGGFMVHAETRLFPVAFSFLSGDVHVFALVGEFLHQLDLQHELKVLVELSEA